MDGLKQIIIGYLSIGLFTFLFFLIRDRILLKTNTNLKNLIVFFTICMLSGPLIIPFVILYYYENKKN
jgi:hypothetical protein